MKTKERIKTILLLVLLMGAAFLTYMTWGSYTGWESDEVYDDVLVTSAEEGSMNVAPLAVSYKTKGTRFGAAYNADSVSAVYNKVSPILKAALAGGKKAATVEESEWQSALQMNGVMLDYEGNVPLDVLNSEFGISDKGYEISARYVLVVDQKVYLKNTDTKHCYRVASNVTEKEITAMLSDATAPRCSLAAEIGEGRVSPETMMMDEKISCFTISSANVAEALNDSQMFNLLKVFGMNYNTCGKHMEADGSRTYVQGFSTLKIQPDGYMIYETESTGAENALTVDSEGEIPTMVEQVKGASAILRALQSISGDECQLYIREVDGVSVKYGRSFSGIPVDRSGNGHSAEIELSGKNIKRIAFSLRNYKGQGDAVFALPQKIAVASAVNAKGKLLSLRYVDTFQGSMDAQWYFRADEK